MLRGSLTCGCIALRTISRTSRRDNRTRQGKFRTSCSSDRHRRRQADSRAFIAESGRTGALLICRPISTTLLPQFSYSRCSGVFSITVTDGETRQLHAGDMVLLEDITPCRGHITVVGDKPGFLLFAR